jgi:hypothetical protein
LTAPWLNGNGISVLNFVSALARKVLQPAIVTIKDNIYNITIAPSFPREMGQSGMILINMPVDR